MDTDESRPSPKKRARRSRGRGLRTNTGWYGPPLSLELDADVKPFVRHQTLTLCRSLTCRKRHRKCDEQQPVCGPCSLAIRKCTYPSSLSSQLLPRTERTPSPPDDTIEVETGLLPSDHSALDIGGHPEPESHSDLPPITNAQLSSAQVQCLSPGQTLPQEPSPAYVGLLGPDLSYTPSAGSAELAPTNAVTTRWLNLLVTDAANADSDFSLPSEPDPFYFDQRPPLEIQILPGDPNQAEVIQTEDPERQIWQLDRDISLTSHEVALFRHFVDNLVGWLDLLDPSSPFASQATRLALRNTGVMKSILGLAAKHIQTSEESHDGRGQSFPHATTPTIARNESVQYHYETLRYVQAALLYHSYTLSEELLITVILVSAYEMLDESDGRGNWQRHLKGVFWIQRSQRTHGECGGLRQAIWWFWLRQDTWAAFREQRRCLTIWKPHLELHELDQHQLARRAFYLLAHAINFSAQNQSSENHHSPAPVWSDDQRAKMREELLESLEKLTSCWDDRFKPLPAVKNDSDEFSPLWIHPPQFAVAVQAYNFAMILITLHSPVSPGFNGYMKMERMLSNAVDTICGVAMEIKDVSCQIFSAQCLYGAGMCVRDRSKREKIISLMADCEKRVKWAPIATWRTELREHWVRVDDDR